MDQPEQDGAEIVIEVVGPITRITVSSEQVDPKTEAINDALHWIWSWGFQIARLTDSTKAQGLGDNESERRRSFSRATLDEHLLAVVGGNLERALRIVSPLLPELELAEDQKNALRLLRNLYEHWDEQRATFKLGVEKNRSGKTFVEEFPHGHPWSIVYDKHDWMLGGVLPILGLSKVLVSLEKQLLSLQNTAESKK